MMITENLKKSICVKASRPLVFKIDLILILPFGHERYAVLSDIINN